MCYYIFVTPPCLSEGLMRKIEIKAPEWDQIRLCLVSILLLQGRKFSYTLESLPMFWWNPWKKPWHLTQSYSDNDILRYHQCCSKSSDKTNKNNDKLWCFMITWWQDQEGWHVMITGRSSDSNCSLWQGTNELVLSTNDYLIPSTFYVYLTPSFLSLIYYEQKYLTCYHISIMKGWLAIVKLKPLSLFINA